jgi:hypothetical protein
MTLLNSTDNLADELSRLRRNLLSNDAQRNGTARAEIEAMLAFAAPIRALGIYDELRKWVNNQTKPLQTLYTLRAQAAAQASATPNDFHVQWTYAVVLKYCRQFDESDDHYRLADALAPSQGERDDLRCDWAELYVYTARAGIAKGMIEASAPTHDWHPWSLAFALHQYAFEADPGANAKDDRWYVASNDVLSAWPAFGSMPDAHLISAANWAGIARRRGTHGNPDSPEKTKAHDELLVFLGANPDWSLTKEKRGPFINGRGNRLRDDPTTQPELRDLKKYRKNYAKHFFRNLRTARRSPNECPESHFNDGANPGDSDPE